MTSQINLPGDTTTNFFPGIDTKDANWPSLANKNGDSDAFFKALFGPDALAKMKAYRAETADDSDIDSDFWANAFGAAAGLKKHFPRSAIDRETVHKQDVANTVLTAIGYNLSADSTALCAAFTALPFAIFCSGLVHSLSQATANNLESKVNAQSDLNLLLNKNNVDQNRNVLDKEAEEQKQRESAAKGSFIAAAFDWVNTIVDVVVGVVDAVEGNYAGAALMFAAACTLAAKAACELMDGLTQSDKFKGLIEGLDIADQVLEGIAMIVDIANGSLGERASAGLKGLAKEAVEKEGAKVGENVAEGAAKNCVEKLGKLAVEERGKITQAAEEVIDEVVNVVKSKLQREIEKEVPTILINGVEAGIKKSVKELVGKLTHGLKDLFEKGCEDILKKAVTDVFKEIGESGVKKSVSEIAEHVEHKFQQEMLEAISKKTVEKAGRGWMNAGKNLAKGGNGVSQAVSNYKIADAQNSIDKDDLSNKRLSSFVDIVNSFLTQITSVMKNDNNLLSTLISTMNQIAQSLGHNNQKINDSSHPNLA